MSRFLIKPGLPFYLSGLALMLQFCRNLRIFVVVPENLRFTHLGAKKNCESWVPSQKNRISSHDDRFDQGRIIHCRFIYSSHFVYYDRFNIFSFQWWVRRSSRTAQ